MGDMTILIAFGAGLVSFLAPCVLPLVPGFLAYLGGVATEKEAHIGKIRGKTFRASIFFVLGFTTVFAILGLVLHGVLLQFAGITQAILPRVGGVVVIFFGLYLMGLIKLGFFERARPFTVHTKFSSRSVTSFVLGGAFALGWTPCAGAALGAIFGLAVLVPAQAFMLLIAYALGLGVPFLIMGFFADRVARYINSGLLWVQYVNILFGGVLVWFGLLAFTQNLAICREVLWSFPF